jgi:abortive infection bacteriophage resistance protein
MKYDKPPLAIDKQITLLRSRGMIIHDQTVAAAAYCIHNSIVILAYLLKNIAPANNWANSIKNTLTECPLPLAAMGFEHGWENDRLFKEID